ncbi:hypothetical protein [Calycomorphotria hydatis]|uniref:Uncharacterized protein n=1 Tax=Calycomorphotria hydatis TaxID=2528027 RepID=A0A517TAD6_9PLAN|nr:hypothetical protein [Calycomorphotria hydatis]QDT65334.1 hypothetical protein V22_25830 [Calycomorphotria hydatis]
MSKSNSGDNQEQGKSASRVICRPPLSREEYVEQRHFFREFRRRIRQNVPSQEALAQIREEILATTQLPHAIDFMRTEIMHSGRLSDAVARIPHYFTPFQNFILQCSEEERTKFDQRIALAILERQAAYLSKKPTRGGLFLYQFESIARNRLGYDRSLEAVAADPLFDDAWSAFIQFVSRNLGVIDLADMIYLRSERYPIDRKKMKKGEGFSSDVPVLFGDSEGRIAKANRGKDPLFFFSALQRQLGYPRVPRPKRKPDEPVFPAPLEERLQRIEKRILIIEAEQKGGLDLEEFYKRPPKFTDDPTNLSE